MEGPVPIVQMKKQVGEVKGFALGRQTGPLGSYHLVRLLHKEGVGAAGRG